MKRHVVFFSALVCLFPAIAVPHWDPQMTGEEYAPLIERLPRPYIEDRTLADIIAKGKRSLDWLKCINSHRPEGQKISFTSAETQPAYPIAFPDYNNPTIIETLYAAFWKESPAGLSDVILGTGVFPTSPPVTDDEYIRWGWRLDRIYQKASRWILQSPLLSQYSALRANDVRGFYHLGKYPDLAKTLQGYSGLPAEEKTNISEWMAGLCANGGTALSSCRTEFRNLVTQNKPLYPYYQKYVAAGQKLWGRYFQLAVKRPDVKWYHSLVEIMSVPFVKPSSPEVERFLTSNIQEEWQLPHWKLELSYQGSSPGTPYIVFEPGATPHVNAVGGNTITMDQNQPLTEYGVQWIIRHEFGHVLGFPDCYVEFYDSDEKRMVAYQLDISNLMCSRRGAIQATHYDEVKKHYGAI